MSAAVSGPDFYEESERDKISLLDACASGKLDEVCAYITEGKVRVNEANEDGVTALQIAASKGHRHVVDYLLRVENASIDVANNAGMTPFLHACREGHADVVTLLINHRANVNLSTGLGVSALTLACAGGHVEVVRILKTIQRQLNFPVTNSVAPCIAPTPFISACYNGDVDMCGYLSHK